MESRPEGSSAGPVIDVQEAVVPEQESSAVIDAMDDASSSPRIQEQGFLFDCESIFQGHSMGTRSFFLSFCL